MSTYFTRYGVLLVSIFILLLTGSCKHDPVDPSNYYFYEYDHSSTILKWTAYKYTEQIGVSGTFKEIGVSGTQIASHPMEVFTDLSFIVNSKSVDSNSRFRDNNIILYFFNQMVTSHFISGNSSRYLGDHSSGTLFVNLELNGIKKEIPFSYSLAGPEITLEAKLDLSDWNAVSALDVMQVCCTEFHTGPDGIHLLWPTIKIEIKTFLERTKK